MFRFASKHIPRIPSTASHILSFTIFGTAYKTPSFSTMFNTTEPSNWPISPYESAESTWPYKEDDFRRGDESPDTVFYKTPRIAVNHIDDQAIERLKRYYAAALPRRGVILDLCTSWTSHFPPEIIEAVGKDELSVHGVGLNEAELASNPSLKAGRTVCDLNTTPNFPALDKLYDAAMCVVSIDYLTKPKEVLTHVRENMQPGAMVHIVVSERCFPTKAVRLWLRLGAEERLKAVGDFLHFSGYADIEVVDLSPTGAIAMFHDRLWVVRGKAPEAQ